MESTDPNNQVESAAGDASGLKRIEAALAIRLQQMLVTKFAQADPARVL